MRLILVLPLLFAILVRHDLCLADGLTMTRKRHQGFRSEKWKGLSSRLSVTRRYRIRLPESVQYVGADRWVLYDIADCELHAFVEADPAEKCGATLLGAV